MDSQPTKEQLLELLRYYDSTRLRALQTQLTKSRNQILDVTSGRLAALFSPAEKEALHQASALLASLSGRVEKAKEARKREEEIREREQETRRREGFRVLAQYFTLPLDSTDEAMTAAAVYIACHDQQRRLWRGGREAAEDLVRQVDLRIQRDGGKVSHVIAAAMSDLRRELQDWITDFPVADMTGEAQRLLARVNDALSDTRRQYAPQLGLIHAQLTIEASDNVTRLIEAVTKR